MTEGTLELLFVESVRSSLCKSLADEEHPGFGVGDWQVMSEWALFASRWSSESTRKEGAG